MGQRVIEKVTPFFYFIKPLKSVYMYALYLLRRGSKALYYNEPFNQRANLLTKKIEIGRINDEQTKKNFF